MTVAQAGFIAPSAKILQGPSSKTTLVGPDGSVISAYAPGGQVVTDEHPGVVAHAAPVLAPVVAHAAPVVAQAAPLAYASHGYADTIVAGPSGTIATGKAVHAAPIVSTVPIAAHIVDSHGHDGEYAHDHSEALYDDGSYKPHFYH